MEYGSGGLPPAVASIITHSWRNGNKNIQKNMESWWRPTRCAAGSLNPHPGLRPGRARCPPLAGSLARRSFSVHGHLAQGISSAYFTKKKTDCFRLVLIRMFGEYGRGEHPSKLGGSPAGDRRSSLRIHINFGRDIVFSADLCYTGANRKPPSEMPSASGCGGTA